MTVNSLAPAYVELFYSATIDSRLHPHTATYPVIPTATPVVGNVPNFVTNDDNDDTATNLITDWIDIMKTAYNGGFTFDRADIYSQPTDDDDPLFIVTIPLAVVGTSITATVKFCRLTCSFKTELGGNARLTLMESIYAVNATDSFPYASVPIDSLADYALGNSGWIRGRDNGKLSTSTRYVTKVDDALRKKYFLKP